MRDPEAYQVLEIEDRGLPVLAAPGLAFGRSRESASRDLDAGVSWPQDSHEGAEVGNVRRHGTMPDLNFDPRILHAERIGPSQDQALTRAELASAQEAARQTRQAGDAGATRSSGRMCAGRVAIPGIPKPAAGGCLLPA